MEVKMDNKTKELLIEKKKDCEAKKGMFGALLAIGGIVTAIFLYCDGINIGTVIAGIASIIGIIGEAATISELNEIEKELAKK